MGPCEIPTECTRTLHSPGNYQATVFIRISLTRSYFIQLSCLSSVLRQLMIFQTDVQRFVNTLKARLGPLLLNAPLLYDGVPEFRTVLQLHGIDISTPKEMLTTLELRIRFQSLVEQIFAVLAEIRLLALFLDDLHEADDSYVDHVLFAVFLQVKLNIPVHWISYRRWQTRKAEW